MRCLVYGKWLTGSIVALMAAGMVTAQKPDFLRNYKGVPFHDSRYNGGAQKIPGTVMCAFYDMGG
jgi:hypothetical protein